LKKQEIARKSKVALDGFIFTPQPNGTELSRKIKLGDK